VRQRSKRVGTSVRMYKKKLSETERRQLETELELEHTRKELEELQMALLTANGLILALQNELAEAKKNEHTKPPLL